MAPLILCIKRLTKVKLWIVAVMTLATALAVEGVSLILVGTGSVVETGDMVAGGCIRPKRRKMGKTNRTNSLCFIEKCYTTLRDY